MADLRKEPLDITVRRPGHADQVVDSFSQAAALEGEEFVLIASPRALATVRTSLLVPQLVKELAPDFSKVPARGKDILNRGWIAVDWLTRDALPLACSVYSDLYGKLAKQVREKNCVNNTNRAESMEEVFYNYTNWNAEGPLKFILTYIRQALSSQVELVGGLPATRLRENRANFAQQVHLATYFLSSVDGIDVVEFVRSLDRLLKRF